MNDQSDNYNWVSVISFIQKQYSKNSLREKQWLFQRQSLQHKINTLEAELASNMISQNDLLKRIRILQIALMQERLHNRQQTLKEEPRKLQYEQLEKKVKTQDHQQFLQKMLNDMGIHQKINYPIEDTKAIHFEFDHRKLKLKQEFPIEFKQINVVASNLDSVRKMYKNTQKTYLATVSEDCLFKIWSYRSVLSAEDAQPVASIREHTGPLFSLSGCTNPYNQESSLLFTAGSQGCIKSWKISDFNNPGVVQLMSTWSNQSDPKYQDNAIWQLQCQENKLLSSSSDGLIRMFHIIQDNNNVIKIQQKTQYKDKQFNSTSIEWISQRTFLSGCQNAPRLTLWDVQQKICQKYIYEVQKDKNVSYSQVNATIYLSHKKIIAAACEDSYLRLFDFDNGQIIKKLKNQNSISCIAIRQPWEILCGCNNGAIYLWDLRKYAIVGAIKDSHLTKYEQGTHCILNDQKYLLSGGADGLIKVYK